MRLLWKQGFSLLAFQRIPNRQSLDARSETLADTLSKKDEDLSGVEEEAVKETPMLDPLNPELNLLTFEKLYPMFHSYSNLNPNSDTTPVPTPSSAERPTRLTSRMSFRINLNLIPNPNRNPVLCCLIRNSIPNPQFRSHLHSEIYLCWRFVIAFINSAQRQTMGKYDPEQVTLVEELKLRKAYSEEQKYL